MTELTEMQQCVMAESVYNALLLLQSMTVEEVQRQLSLRWVPAWASVEKVVTPENVEQALATLTKLEVVRKDDHRYSVVSRNTLVVTDYDKKALKKVMVK